MATTPCAAGCASDFSGDDFYEVIDGLAPGEEVILSDMKDYQHLNRVN